MTSRKPNYNCPVTGKHRYPNQFHAECKLDLIQSPGQVNRVPTRAYLCEFCAKWHLTSEPIRRSA